MRISFEKSKNSRKWKAPKPSKAQQRLGIAVILAIMAAFVWMIWVGIRGGMFGI